MTRDSGTLVFSTDGSHREACPRCGRHPCRCTEVVAIIPSRTLLRLNLEKKGRKGKGVTLISGLPNNPEYGAGLLRKLKAHCGSGGARKGEILELQGDQRKRAQEFLAGLGFNVRVGGG